MLRADIASTPKALNKEGTCPEKPKGSAIKKNLNVFF